MQATGGANAAGIGGGEKGSGGDITIDGGIVRATGGDNGAGIGGGYSGRGGTITISGGSIESDGGHCGAAIGGGNAGTCESITITNGSFNLKGGTSGAGIGGGNGKSGIIINISGGTFHHVLGGVQAAGIGGGDGGDGGKITITGGTFLSVKGGEKGAGIGGGYYGQSGKIVINSGTIDATGGANGGARIGAGIYHPDAIVWDTTITINGGSITAYGSDGYEDDELPGAAIGCGGRDVNSSHTADYGWYTGTIDLNGGIVKAFASSRVGNYEEDDNSLTAIGLWRVEGNVCGTVHFGDADVTMSSTMDNSGQYSQVVKAGTITFDDDRLVKYMSYDTDELIKAKHDDRSNVLQGRQYSTVYVETCTHEDCQYTDKGDNHSLACPYCAKNAAENHKYSESDLNWNWAEDQSSATATFTCEKCNHEKPVAAAVKKTVDDAGMATYTATAEIDGKSYTDSVTDYADDLGVRVIGHSISLEGDIGVNFYMELSDAVADSDTAYMHFTIPKKGEPDTKDIMVSDARKVESGDKTYYVFKCQVAAKEMTSDIKAQIIDGDRKGMEYTYSVKDYADYLLAHTDEREDLAKAAPLVKALLNYGAYTQIYFDKNPDKLANVGLTEEEKALGEVSITVADYDVSGLPAGVTFAGATLSLKSETTLSLYFKSDDDLEFSCGDYFVQDVPNGEYQVARIRGIKATDIGDVFTLNVSGAIVKYSPLNYIKNALDGGTDDVNLQNAVKALYLYWDAANMHFEGIDLSTVTGSIVVQDGGIITGTLSGNHKISIAEGATVRLRNADITSLANNEYVANYAGITLLGDATIILEGTNTVRGGEDSYPGIYVPVGKTLTIDGTGSLVASSNGFGCGIGGGSGIRCGNITIDGGIITATGGARAAGIGGGNDTSCGDITINGGIVQATGGEGAAGIGSGRYKNASCGDITINGGTVTATGGQSATGIGTGAYQASCGNITIANTVTQVTATRGTAPLLENSIGKSWGCTCGTVTIGGVEGAVSESPYTYRPE